MAEEEHTQKEKKDKKEKHHRKHHRRSHEDKSRAAAKMSAAADPRAMEEEEAEDWNANRERVEKLCLVYPNNICNDCNNSGTRWASVNHGVFVCIRCSGIHRSLGVHISKVKSTNMDKWHAAEVSLMEAIGNQKGKALYEARIPKNMKPLTGSEPESVIRTFIQQKYQEKTFAGGNVTELLHQYHKQTRYGKKPKKTHQQSRHRDGKDGTDAEGGAKLREDTMKALYGANAEAMTKRSKKVKPIHGTFGVVNIPPDEYDARRRTLFAHFHVTG